MKVVAVDAVVEAALRGDALDDLVARIEAERWSGIGGHGIVHVPYGPQNVLSAFQAARTPDGLKVRANGLHLGPGVIYRSEQTLTVTQDVEGSAEAGGRPIVVAASLSVGTAAPESMLAALAGRHVSACVSHHALTHPALIVERAETEGWRDANGVVFQQLGFSLLLPQIWVEAG